MTRRYAKLSLIFLLLWHMAAFAEHSLSQQIEKLQKAFQKDTIRQSHLEQELKKRDIALSQLSQQLKQLNQSLIEATLQLESLKRQQQVTETRLFKQRKELSRYLKTLYQLGELQPVKIILNQEDIHTLQRRLNYYHHLSQKEWEKIHHLKETLN